MKNKRIYIPLLDVYSEYMESWKQCFKLINIIKGFAPNIEIELIETEWL